MSIHFAFVHHFCCEAPAMARLARAEVFAHDEIAIVHVMNRVVRRCFLIGDDPVSGKNYDHRKVWIENDLRRLAAQFGIDLLGFSILSNHFHLILRSRPDVVATWNDAEVARRWCWLCPQRKAHDGSPLEPTAAEINSIANNPDRVAELRRRLSNISWWMRLLCQNFGQRANAEDRATGKFWESRYRAVRLLDDTALLACAAYVDLNPIRAGIAESLPASGHTSIQRRLQAFAPTTPATAFTATGEEPVTTPSADADVPSTGLENRCQTLADAFLSPLAIDELNDSLGPCPSDGGRRCSDKGFLPLSIQDYIRLLDWTARQQVARKRGVMPASLPPVLSQLGLAPESWCQLVGRFGEMFFSVAGQPTVIDSARSRLCQRRFRVRPAARKLFCDAN